MNLLIALVLSLPACGSNQTADCAFTTGARVEAVATMGNATLYVRSDDGIVTLVEFE